MEAQALYIAQQLGDLVLHPVAIGTGVTAGAALVSGAAGRLSLRIEALHTRSTVAASRQAGFGLQRVP